MNECRLKKRTRLSAFVSVARSTGMSDLADAFRRYMPLVERKCRRMLSDGQDVDDVAQETFIRFWQRGLAETPAPQAVAWLYKTCTHLAIDRLRARARRQQLHESRENIAASPGDALFARRACELLAATAATEDLEVALLARVDGLDQKEVASVLGITDRTVRRALARFDEQIAHLRQEAL
jgi:RNA polymerase sigma-70 factor (ECF subfamily)